MTRKKLLLATMGLVALLAVVVTGLIYAGPLGQSENDVPIPDHAEKIGEIIQEHEGDDRLLATVNGHDFTAGELRVGYEHQMVVEPGLTEDEAIKTVILHRFDDIMLASEAESRGLTTSEDEARELMRRTKDLCESDENFEAECRDTLRRMGLDYDDYWEQGIPVFQRNHTALKAMSAIRSEYLENNDTDAEGERLDWLVLQEVRETADIFWHDNDIETLYDEAVVARVNELSQPPVTPTPPGGPDDTEDPVGNVND